MTIKAGLVGLPNVGKSTLFNALTNSQVPAENYPFCTIDPHIAITKVPDEKLINLAKIFNSQKLLPATITFVDIAGLVKGAAQGEGLGNQFLSHIREVDLILHVIRCFEGSGDINPFEHFDTIITELLLKDIEMIEKRIIKIGSLIKASQNKSIEKQTFEAEKQLLEQLLPAYNNQDLDQIKYIVSRNKIATIQLLGTKKFLIIANIEENDYSEQAYLNNELYKKIIQRFGKDNVIPVCAKTECELSKLDEIEKQEMMNMLGIIESGLNTIITKTYQTLGLITFFTVGPKEAHAWPILNGINIRNAAGEIHSDLERGFICAEIYNYTDIFTLKTEDNVKQAGKLRNEGQHYIVKDGDIVHIKFNV